MENNALKDLIITALVPDSMLPDYWSSWLRLNDIDSIDSRLGVQALIAIFLRNVETSGSVSEYNRIKGVYKKSWFESRDLLKSVVELFYDLQKVDIPMVITGDMALACYTIGIERFPVLSAEILLSEKNHGDFINLLRMRKCSYCDDYLIHPDSFRSLHISEGDSRVLTVHFLDDEHFVSASKACVQFIDGQSYQCLSAIKVFEASLISLSALETVYPLRTPYLFYLKDADRSLQNKISILRYFLPGTWCSDARYKLGPGMIADLCYGIALISHGRFRIKVVRAYHAFGLLIRRPSKYVPLLLDHLRKKVCQKLV